jgi:hypothetical protein
MIAVPVIDLPGARLAHHAQHLARRDVEAHVVDGDERPAPRVELHAEVLHLEKRGAHGC